MRLQGQKAYDRIHNDLYDIEMLFWVYLARPLQFASTWPLNRGRCIWSCRQLDHIYIGWMVVGICLLLLFHLNVCNPHKNECCLFFGGTRVIGLAQGLELGRINSSCSISSIAPTTNWRLDKGVLYACWEIGLPLTSIVIGGSEQKPFDSFYVEKTSALPLTTELIISLPVLGSRVPILKQFLLLS